MQTEDKVRRFDDVFRTLLIVGTIMFTFSVTFQRAEIAETSFVGYVMGFTVAILSWCFGRLYSKFEIASKIFAWFFLVIIVTSSYVRMFYSYSIFPHSTSIVIVTTGYGLSYLLFWYLSPDDKYSRKAIFNLTILWLSLVFYPLVESFMAAVVPFIPDPFLATYMPLFLTMLLSASGIGIFLITLKRLKNLHDRIGKRHRVAGLS